MSYEHLSDSVHLLNELEKEHAFWQTRVAGWSEALPDSYDAAQSATAQAQYLVVNDQVIAQRKLVAHLLDEFNNSHDIPVSLEWVPYHDRWQLI